MLTSKQENKLWLRNDECSTERTMEPQVQSKRTDTISGNVCAIHCMLESWSAPGGDCAQNKMGRTGAPVLTRNQSPDSLSRT